MKIKTLIALFAIAAVGVLAPTAMPADRSGTVAVHSSRFGRARGFVLDAFTKDARQRSHCSGACAAAWPPYIVSARPKAGAGTKAALLGTTRRADGKLQVTYAGRPLYYYVGDRRPRQILCQNVLEFGGLWLVVRPSGALVR